MNARVAIRDDANEVDSFHRGLAAFNQRRLTPTSGETEWQRELGDDHAWRLREGRFVATEQQVIASKAAAVPVDPDAFVAWFEALAEDEHDEPDFLLPWLAEEAPREAMLWFLTQEVPSESGLDDLLAMTQVRLPAQAKLALARNYWDEMGHGKGAGAHGRMLEDLARELGIVPGAPVVWESLALANMMTALATNRRYAFASVGALGFTEMTKPRRAAPIAAGLRRLGVGADARRYYTLHAMLDVKHAASFKRDVLRPLAANSATARAMAEGALMRREAGRRCVARYGSELRGSIPAWRRRRLQLRAAR